MFTGAGTTPSHDKVVTAGTSSTSADVLAKKASIKNLETISGGDKPGKSGDTVNINSQTASGVSAIETTEQGRGASNKTTGSAARSVESKPQLEGGETAQEQIAFLKDKEKNLPPPPAADNMRKLIKDIEERFHNEDRIPPSLFQTVQDLISKSLQSGSDEGLDEIA